MWIRDDHILTLPEPRPVKCEGNWIMVGGLFGSAVIILVLVIVGLVFRIAHQRKLQKGQPSLSYRFNHGVPLFKLRIHVRIIFSVLIFLDTTTSTTGKPGNTFLDTLYILKYTLTSGKVNPM